MNEIIALDLNFLASNQSFVSYLLPQCRVPVGIFFYLNRYQTPYFSF